MKLPPGPSRLQIVAIFGAASWVAFFLLSALRARPLSAPMAQPLRVAPSARGKERVLAVVGVMTGRFDAQRVRDGGPKYDYVARRAALLHSWFPSTAGEVARVRDMGLVIKFVVSREHDADVRALASELPGSVMVLDEVESETYLDLPTKVHAFLAQAAREYDVDWVVKADDDIWLNPERLAAALKEWGAMGDYVGCMKTGPIFTSPDQRWYEPDHALLGSKEYFRHAWGPIYALQRRAVEAVTQIPAGSLRHFANEDVTVGAWMLALAMAHHHDPRLCSAHCSATSVAVYDIPRSAGLLDPQAQLPVLASDPCCTDADGSSCGS